MTLKSWKGGWLRGSDACLWIRWSKVPSMTVTSCAAVIAVIQSVTYMKQAHKVYFQSLSYVFLIYDNDFVEVWLSYICLTNCGDISLYDFLFKNHSITVIWSEDNVNLNLRIWLYSLSQPYVIDLRPLLNAQTVTQAIALL